MLPRALRLPLRGERRKPAFVSRTNYFSLKVFVAGSLTSRFAIVIGKAVSKSAVKRNSLKRFFAKELRGVSYPSALDIVLTVLPSSLSAKREFLKKELERAIQKIPTITSNY